MTMRQRIHLTTARGYLVYAAMARRDGDHDSRRYFIKRARTEMLLARGI